jgi:hypothetical protein
MNLATNQRAQRRDRTNVCVCHLDHLLQLPWAHRRRVPPTEAARPKLCLKDDVDCGASKASSCPLYDRLRANAARAEKLRGWDPLTFAHTTTFFFSGGQGGLELLNLVLTPDGNPPIRYDIGRVTRPIADLSPKQIGLTLGKTNSCCAESKCRSLAAKRTLMPSAEDLAFTVGDLNPIFDRIDSQTDSVS